MTFHLLFAFKIPNIKTQTLFRTDVSFIIILFSFDESLMLTFPFTFYPLYFSSFHQTLHFIAKQSTCVDNKIKFYWAISLKIHSMRVSFVVTCTFNSFWQILSDSIHDDPWRNGFWIYIIRMLSCRVC